MHTAKTNHDLPLDLWQEQQDGCH